MHGTINIFFFSDLIQQVREFREHNSAVGKNMNIFSVIKIIYITFNLPRSKFIALQFRLYMEFFFKKHLSPRRLLGEECEQ